MESNRINSFRLCLGLIVDLDLDLDLDLNLNLNLNPNLNLNGKIAATEANGIWLTRLFHRPRLIKY